MEPMDLGGLLTVDTRRAATLNQGDADAARIALFLAYARDNAQLLGLTDAFGSEPIDVAHAGKLAVRVADGLGMDERAFGKYVETIAAKDLKRALASEYINPGVLEVTGDPGSDGRVSRALDLLEDISSDRNHQIFLAEAELARSVLLGARDGRPIHSVCDPTCGHGGLLVRFHRAAGGAWPVVTATDTDAASIAITSMRLLVDGYRGGFEHVRQADSFAVGSIPGVGFDAVLCEAPHGSAKREAARTEVDPRILDGMDGRKWVKGDVEGLSLLRAADLLAEGGTAVVITATGDSYALPQVGLRQRLVEDGLVEACIEIPRRLPYSWQTGLTMWVLSRRGVNGTLLAVLDGDGFQAECPDFYSSLDSLESSSRWLADLVTSRREVPFMSTVVSREKILETPGSPLRFSGYATSIDVAGRLREGPSSDEIAARHAEVLAELAAAEKELDETFSRVVHPPR